MTEPESVIKQSTHTCAHTYTHQSKTVSFPLSQRKHARSYPTSPPLPRQPLWRKNDYVLIGRTAHTLSSARYGVWIWLELTEAPFSFTLLEAAKVRSSTKKTVIWAVDYGASMRNTLITQLSPHMHHYLWQFSKHNVIPKFTLMHHVSQLLQPFLTWTGRLLHSRLVCSGAPPETTRGTNQESTAEMDHRKSKK